MRNIFHGVCFVLLICTSCYTLFLNDRICRLEKASQDSVVEDLVEKPKVTKAEKNTAPAMLLIVRGVGDEECERIALENRDGFLVPHKYTLNCREIWEEFRVSFTPTLILLDKNGKEIKRKCGYAPPDEIKAWIAER